MYGIEDLIITIDSILNTSRKRHTVGGILLSMSMLFSGLALTVMTIKDNEPEEQDE